MSNQVKIPSMGPIGTAMIRDERFRQLRQEGYTLEKDDEHDHGELAIAAGLYALHSAHVYTSFPPYPLGWVDKRDKHSRLRGLVKAGAMIAAEIDRLLRAGESP